MRRRLHVRISRRWVWPAALASLVTVVVSASLASLFVREEERPRDEREALTSEALLTSLGAIEARLAALEASLADQADADGVVPSEDVGRRSGTPDA